MVLELIPAKLEGEGMEDVEEVRVCGGTGARWPLLLHSYVKKLFGMELPRASGHSREEAIAYNSGRVNQARERQ